MRYALAALILAATTLPAIAGQGTTTVCDYRKNPNAPVCGKVYLPDKAADRLPGDDNDCALTGGKNGPDGCVKLMNGEPQPVSSGSTIIEKSE